MLPDALELVLQYEQVVGGGDGDDALVRVPRRVQDLFVEIEAVDADLVLERRGRKWDVGVYSETGVGLTYKGLATSLILILKIA